MAPGQANNANEMIRINMQLKAYETLKSDVVQLKTELKSDFRINLGVK